MTINKELFSGILIFVEVVKTGSFAMAAQNLQHANSHVSKTIKQLEQRLGCRLLNRTTRSLSLTPEGEVYFQECQDLIESAENALNLLNQNPTDPKGILKISSPIGFTQSHLSGILTHFCQQYPNIQLEMNLSDTHVDMIAEGYDIVIRASQELQDSNLICRKIHQSDIVTLASTHYLAKRGTPFHPNELSQHDCLCYSNIKRPTDWEYQDKHGNPIKVSVRQKTLSNNSQAQLTMAEQGLGIIRIPEFYLATLPKPHTLVPLFEDYPKPSVNVYVMYPSRKHLSPKVRCFINVLTERLALTD